MALSQHKATQQLIDIVGKQNVISGEAAKHYGHDRCDFYSANNELVVFPTSTEQVREIILLANQQQLKLVPSGGRTGLSGGAAATQQEIVVAMDKMNTIKDFNPIENSVLCGAGLITKELQEFAIRQDLLYPIDFASAGSSQIGGNISTNAGGIHVIRYGMTRDWVLGLTVVTGKGDILHLNHGLQKNNTGYDLRQLFIGSEGTLGFITEVCIKLCKPPKDLRVLLFSVTDISNIMQIFQHFNNAISLHAFEFFSDIALQKVCHKMQLSPPFSHQQNYYVLLEVDIQHSEIESLTLTLSQDCLEQQWAQDCVVSQSQQQAKTLWRFREGISTTLAQWQPYKNDLSVTASKVPAFLKAISAIVSSDYSQFEVVWYGHIGDGNLHLNILKPDDLSSESFKQQCNDVSKKIMAIVKDFNGSISAEHGVGLLKKDFLSYSRSAEEIAYMKQLKQLFDPNSVMNPGKIF